LKLTQLQKGQKAIIKKIDAPLDLKQRLYSLGVVKGTEIELIDYSLGKSTLEIKAGNSLIALREKEAQQIEVE
jgi:ferrous iron transport protein A